MAGTTVQRKTLVGALLIAGAIGAGTIALTGNDGGRADIISNVDDTTTTEATSTTEATTTTVEVTTAAAPTTTAAPSSPTAPPASVPLEEKVAEHEQRISDLEDVVTTTTSSTTTTTTDPCALLKIGSPERAACDAG